MYKLLFLRTISHSRIIDPFQVGGFTINVRTRERVKDTLYARIREGNCFIPLIHPRLVPTFSARKRNLIFLSIFTFSLRFPVIVAAIRILKLDKIQTNIKDSNDNFEFFSSFLVNQGIVSERNLENNAVKIYLFFLI